MTPFIRNFNFLRMKTLHRNRFFKTKTITNKHKLLFCATFLFSINVFSQNPDSTKVRELNEVLVSATRINAKTPMSFSNMNQKDIERQNLGQDIPILLQMLPSVVTTSDAGNGFGYTGMRVRGSDASRVNVTLNGIPYNDSESQGTFFVNLPDFASSLQSIQLQRGAGSSTNGSGAFGASLNLLTENASKESKGEISNAFGSFNSRKSTVKWTTGLINHRFEISGRLSNLYSDGYIDRASSKLKSYFLQAHYVGKTTHIKALSFGGSEKTYQAWYGLDEATLHSHRTFNYAGMYVDANGNTQFYDNQTDNYQQDHYQLHWNEKWHAHWNTNLAFHYTKGKGYYEEYQQNQNFSDYGLQPVVIGNQTLNQTDLIRQKWLDNDFYGTTFSVNYQKNNTAIILGSALNQYKGSHFGKIIWAQYASNSTPNVPYYNYFGNKNEANFFVKINANINTKWAYYLDLQHRSLQYEAIGVLNDKVNESYSFWNPKAGLTFNWNKHHQFYLSYAKAQKEPNRTDFENGTPKPEKLHDFELGWRFEKGQTQCNFNSFYMLYQDQLVLTGALDNVGNPIRTNVGKSYRLGVEMDAQFWMHSKWHWNTNLTWSANRNLDFVTTNHLGITTIGKTNIAFSPKIIFGNALTFVPQKSLQLVWLSKFVGTQYLSNANDPNAMLKDYFVHDLMANYEIKPKNIFKSIQFLLKVNNIFNVQYVSNGADYGGGYVYYFPQAGSNFLLGLNLKF